MPDDKKTFKEKRQERQQARVDKLTKERIAEAKAAGVDVTTPSETIVTGPQRKSDIDAKINAGVKDDLKAGLQKIQSVRQAPEVKIPEKPSINLTIDDVRKERRNKIANIMNAFGQGLAGEQLDAFKYTRPYKEERLAQYQQYKDTSQAAKKALDEWGTGYINEQLNYLYSMKNDPNTSELKKRQIEKEIALKEAQIAKTKAETSKIRSTKPDQETVRVTEKFGDGDTTATREMPLSEWEAKDAYNKALNAADSKVDQARIALEQFGNEGTSFWETKDKPIRAQLENDLRLAEEERQAIIDSGEGKTNTQTTTPTPNKESKNTGNKLKDIVEGL